MLKQQIDLPEFDFIKASDKQFITAFTDELEKLGYYENGLCDGFCWGRYMLIYRKSGVKSKNVYARIYIRDDCIVLRLFLNNVTKHGEYIDRSPEFIKDAFVGNFGKCKRCKGDNCKFRKDYEIGGVKYEKCNGFTFQFFEPTMERLTSYIDLFKEFYPAKSYKSA
jgi:hypothetical protein